MVFIGTVFSVSGTSAEYKIKSGVNVVFIDSDREIISSNDNEILLVGNHDSIEVIDQQQTSSSGHGCPFFNYLWLAQGFIPSLEILTKVEVKLFKGGNPTSPIIISIRDSLNGNDLTSVSVDSSLVSLYSKWIEFNFPDIDVIPGNEYFIVCRSSGGSMINYYCAMFDINNPYGGGEAWGSIDYGANWELIEDYYPEYPEPDACFKTYGLDESPNIPMISGETSGNAGTEYEYTFNAIDPDGDDVKYHIDWDDGNPEETGFNPSGDDVKLKNTWNNEGTYTITAYAEDEYGLVGPEGTLTVIMPRNRAINTPFLNFLQQYPNLFPMLSLLFQR